MHRSCERNLDLYNSMEFKNNDNLMKVIKTQYMFLPKWNEGVCECIKRYTKYICKNKRTLLLCHGVIHDIYNYDKHSLTLNLNESTIPHLNIDMYKVYNYPCLKNYFDTVVSLRCAHYEYTNQIKIKHFKIINYLLKDDGLAEISTFIHYFKNKTNFLDGTNFKLHHTKKYSTELIYVCKV